MDYWRYDITCTSELAEVLIAFLSDGPFDTFEDTAFGFSAYCQANNSPEEVSALFEPLKFDFDFEWTKTFLPSQNWNKIWESNFQPVIVGHFCAIRADFHEPIPGVKWELVINPKMAFGTGHHETTWQCLAALEHLPVKGTKLLDYGCGTGILAIMAAKLGAAAVEAVDIETASYENTLENCEVNQVNVVTARCGTLDAVRGRDFDGILANINRHVILPALSVLSTMIRPGGWLLVSGILEQDDDDVTTTALAAGFIKVKQTKRGNWLCIEFQKQRFGLKNFPMLRYKPFLWPFLWLALVTILSTRPVPNLPKFDLFAADKIGHAFAYAVLSCLFLWAWMVWKAQSIPFREGFVAFCTATIYGILMEVVQGTFFPNRKFEVDDMLANAFGAAIGWIFFHFVIVGRYKNNKT